MGAFHLMTQVDTSVILSFLTFRDKDKTTLVSTYVIKWKVAQNYQIVLYIILKDYKLYPSIYKYSLSELI